jgi:hypothetical protein
MPFKNSVFDVLCYLGSSELHPFPAVPRVAVADGGRGAGGLAPLHTQGSGLQGGEGQPHLQVHI